jgi:hypothetical protein
VFGFETVRIRDCRKGAHRRRARIRLEFSVLPHHSGMADQSQESKLCDPTKVGGFALQAVEPGNGGGIVSMTAIRCRNSEVDIREKGFH